MHLVQLFYSLFCYYSFKYVSNLSWTYGYRSSCRKRDIFLDFLLLVERERPNTPPNLLSAPGDFSDKPLKPEQVRGPRRGDVWPQLCLYIINLRCNAACDDCNKRTISTLWNGKPSFSRTHYSDGYDRLFFFWIYNGYHILKKQRWLNRKRIEKVKNRRPTGCSDW